MRVAVNTPTGHIGGVLSEHLLNAGVEVVLPVRHPDKVARLAERGAVVHRGDLQDADFVAKVTAGVDVLFWLTPPNLAAGDFRGFQNTLGDNAATAVKENRIPRVVDVSSIGAQHGSGTGPIVGLGDVEKTLEETGAHVTHLRPAYYMENYLTAVRTIVSDHAIYLPVRSDIGMPMIATEDIAKAAAHRILDKSWTGRSVVELVGPSEITFADAAEMIGEAVGHEVSHVTTTPEQTRESMIGMGVPPATAGLFIEMYEAITAGRFGPESPGTVRIGSTTFRTFIEEVLRPKIKSASAARK